MGSWTEQESDQARSERTAEELAVYRDAGFSRKSAQAILEIDSAMTQIRRLMQRREILNTILAQLDPRLDLARLDVMVTIMHWPAHDDADREITVGAVAEHLKIDPSRASRLVADVIDLGYIRRAASQADSRRIVLEPTDEGLAFGAKFRQLKCSAFATGLKGWPEADLVEFARLIERFSHWGPDYLRIVAEAARSAAE
jgi:DNA-binding MarR family transcriptional regulator